MAHLDGVVELDDLIDEGLGGNQTHLVALVLYGRQEVSLVDYGALDAREEVADDVLEEGQVVLEELRHVDVAEGAQEELLLVHVGVGLLEEARGVYDRADGAHAVVYLKFSAFDVLIFFENLMV